MRNPKQLGIQGEKRRRRSVFDRVKYLTFLGLVTLFFVGKDVNAPFTTITEALSDFAASTLGRIVIVAAGLEIVRQVHYLVSERWSGYHRFWVHRVYGGWDRTLARRLSVFTRSRIRRALFFIVLILLWGTFISLVRDDITGPLEGITQTPAVIADILPFVLQLAFAFFFIAFQFIGLFWFLSRGGIDVLEPEDIETRFDDVWGQDHVLSLVRENIAFLEKPDEIEAKGGYIPGGILLWGPPGTGKTMMAQAIAGETGKPYVFVDPGAFIQMFFGIGVLKVKRLFRKLRKLSLQHGGVIVFFDEADSLGNRGAPSGGPGPFQHSDLPGYLQCNGTHFLSPFAQQHVSDLAPSTGAAERRGLLSRFMMGGMGGGGGGMGVLQALLTELSGLEKPRGIGYRLRRIFGVRPKPPPKYRILVMMATNMPNSLDQALLRPGRIDRIYKVGFPSKDGRKRTLEGYLSKVTHSLSEEDLERISVTTPYYSGAKIKDLVNEALILTIRDGRETVTFDDVWRAKALKEMGPPEDAEYIVRERYAVAIHEASHAVASHLLSTRRSIDMVTIERRGNVGGFVRSLDIEDRFTSWRTELEADIKVSLASLAGERMFFDADNSSGVTGDLRNATQLASYMEGVYGMGDQLLSFAGLSGGMFGSGDPAEKIVTTRAKKVETRLKHLYDEVYELLEDHRDKLLALAEVLVDERTISGDRVTEVMGSEPGLSAAHEPTGFTAFDPETKPLGGNGDRARSVEETDTEVD